LGKKEAVNKHSGEQYERLLSTVFSNFAPRYLQYLIFTRVFLSYLLVIFTISSNLKYLVFV